MRTLRTLIAASLLSASAVQAQTTWTLDSTVLVQTDVVTGITRPWEILWGPDDYIWSTCRNGDVLHIDPVTGNYTTILELTVSNNGSGEPGLLGMALHPDFTNTPKVFLVYNYSQGNSVKERLSSFDWNGTSLTNETYLIDNIPGNQIHNGARLVISPDGKIMMTTGDIGTGGDLSQDLVSKNGKVLRINLDGSIPSDNPDPSSYVWSFGHRNGQGLCYGPSGILYESEHGQNSSDELNIIEAGRNYGWPEVQGACNTNAEIAFCEANNVVEPIEEWSPCVAVNGLEYYNHPAIPEWQNSLIMGVMGGLNGTSGSNDRVSILHLSDDGLSVLSEDKLFTSLNQRFRDVCINPNTGALYVALNGTQYPGTAPNKIIMFAPQANTNNVVNKPTIGQTMNLYPNPAQTEFTIEVANSLIGSDLVVFGYDGKQAATFKIQSTKQQIDISNLPAGSYWTVATSALGTVTRTFTKL
ncbi:MAG: PQQ-dependent sugar dehydrogenase [Flavobacteriales bacterium]